MPELLWKAFIDFEIDQQEYERARKLYSKLLRKTQHVKVREKGDRLIKIRFLLNRFGLVWHNLKHLLMNQIHSIVLVMCLNKPIKHFEQQLIKKND